MNGLVSLGHGNTADVYEWGAGEVLKLFKQGYKESVYKEFEINQQVMKTDLRVPKAKQVIHYEDRYAIIYERIDGLTMYEAMSQQSTDMTKWGERLAEIHHHIHSCSVPSLSSPKEEITLAIENCDRLSLELRNRILSIFRVLPDDQTVLCHGDLHPLNIIMVDENPVVIDWMNSRSYHPLADVALSSIILQVAGLPSSIQYFHEAYMERYLKLSSFDYIDLLRWQIPMAVSRLHENKENEINALVQLIEKNLQIVSTETDDERLS